MNVRVSGPGRKAEAPVLEAVLTDMDGTLVDTETRLYEGWVDIAARYGHDFKKQFAYANIIGRTDLECATIVGRHFKIDRSPQELYDEYKAAVRQNIAEHGVDLMPHAEQFLHRAKDAGLQLALVTSSVREHVDLALGPHELLPLFDAVVTADTPGLQARKPAPDPYLLAASMLHVKHEHCCVVEDSPAGVEAGLAAGCYVFGVPHQHSLAHGLARAHTVLWNLDSWRPELVRFERIR